MKKIPLQFFLLLLITFATSCASIDWSASRPLTWDDFKGTRDNGFEAYTYCRVRYHCHPHRTVDGKQLINFTMYCRFKPGSSWVVNGNGKPELLRHEQLHFDICEVYARKLYIALTKKSYTSHYWSEIHAITKIYSKQLKETEERYDAETNHSLIKPRQQEWEAAIHEELNQTPAYPVVSEKGVK